MPYCPNCGSPVKPEERYCFSCGTKIVPVTEPLAEDTGLADPVYDEHTSDRRDRQIEGSDYEAGRYDGDRTADRETAEPRPYPPQGSDTPYDSQEKYSKAPEPIENQPPLPPISGAQQYPPNQQAPLQQPPPQPQVPARPSHSILSGIGKILEIILYLGFILIAVAGLYLLYKFANSIGNFG